MKAKVILVASLVGEAAVYAAALYWLVGISIALDIVLACTIVGVLYTLRHVAHNKGLFNINDAELVRVSALANHLEQKVIDLEDKLQEAERDVEDLKDRTIRSGHQFDERTAA